ncbi:MAG: hypothetical protein AUI52_04995 [Acidobacteria bacterium 13_1_40CM_2_68_10]|nr:MAG: hypothetical protein AUI52_04995 [Acidobacteria bacterium 13_1_40CM_2_68_10]OLE65270.1 MAG: hypothetical protein AUG03_05590 [Acidobacteria bacterium 13_1_20CM_2_68_14]
MTGLFILKALLVAAVVLMFLTTVGTITYRITDTALEVRILGRVIRRILLADIEEVHRRGALVHENWSSLKFWNSVTIRRRSGLLRNFMISPDDPDRFAARLQEAARRSVGDVTL